MLKYQTMTQIVEVLPKIRHECPICCDETEAPLVKCHSCEGRYCRACFYRYILTCKLDPKCMHCGGVFQLFRVIEAADKDWFQTIYRAYRQKIIWKNSESLIQTFTLHRDGTIPNGDNNYLNNAMYPCPRPNCIGIVVKDICTSCTYEFCDKCREIYKYGHICDSSLVYTIKLIKANTRPCPKCSIAISKISGCDQMFCVQCHTKFSWDSGRIIEGFFHNPHYFDWKLAQSIAPVGPLAPLKPEYDCDAYISYANLLGCFSFQEQSESVEVRKKRPATKSLFAELATPAQYLLAFKNFHMNILDIRASSGNHADIELGDNHDLFAKYLDYEIMEFELCEELEKRDFDFKKSMAYAQIYITTFRCSAILFDNLYAFAHRKVRVKTAGKNTRMDFLYSIYFQMQTLLEYSNESLALLDKIYGPDERFLQFGRQPFHLPKVVVDVNATQ